MNLAHRLACLVSKHLKIRARSEKPGLLGRSSGAFISETDWTEAYACGQAAVHAVLGGESGKMVTLVRESDAPYRVETGLIDLERVALLERSFPRHWRNAEGNDVFDAFARYAAPIVGDILHHDRLRPITISKKLFDTFV